jgi:hypothetical protein
MKKALEGSNFRMGINGAAGLYSLGMAAVECRNALTKAVKNGTDSEVQAMAAWALTQMDRATEKR